MKKYSLALWLALLLMLFTVAARADEVVISFSPEAPHSGDVVDVTVEAGESAEVIIYNLSLGDRKIFSGKEDSHFSSSFRPREEGTYLLTVQVKDKEGNTGEGKAEIRVSGTAEVQMGAEVIYSQKDGWWENKSYSSRSNLEAAGCAIFTLSHALQRMGWSGEDVLPEVLAKTYAGCYTQNGTANERLITRASEVYGYTTKSDLLENKAAIRDALKKGDMFSFSIVIGHIALAGGIDDSGTKAKIVDSAPGATFERIKKGKVYYLKDGAFQEAKGPEDIPGARYFFETQTWGGLEYYMDLDYLARRGVRLIRPGWLFLQTDAGLSGVAPENLGSALSTVSLNAESQEVFTSSLIWLRDGQEQKMAVVTTKNSAKLTDADGKKVGSVPACGIVPVLEEEDSRVLVIYGEDRGYLSKKNAEVVPVLKEFRTGKISLKGNTSGRAKINVRFGPGAKDKIMGEWKTGTRVAITAEKEGFYQVEAKGLRVWVQAEYLTLD